MMQDKSSLMDKMASKKAANPDEDQKILDMYHELDNSGKQEIMSKLEDLCGYYDQQGNNDNEGEGDTGDMPQKHGVAIIISKGK